MLGLNHRESVQDATYDIQTQDVGTEQCLVESRVYRNGKILDTVRKPYPEDEPLSKLQERVRRQHEGICGKVRERSYELVFLWVSRGIIAFESQDYLESLNCFESVLAVEETHQEANSYLERIRSYLADTPVVQREVEQRYQDQIRSLVSEGRVLEAKRKEVLLERLGSPLSGPVRNLEPPTVASLPPPRKPGRLGRVASVREKVRDCMSFARDAGVLRGYAFVVEKVRDGVSFFRNPGMLKKYAAVSLASVVLLCSIGLVVAHVQKKQNPDPPFAMAMAMAHLKDNKPLPARDLLFGVLRSRPASEEALRLFWQTFDEEEDYAQAAPMLQALLRIDSASPLLHLYLAESYRKQNQYAEAIEQYQTAVEKKAPQLACAIGTALCLLDRQEPQAAIDLLEAQVQRGLDDFRIDYCLGMAYQELGRPGRASVHYAQALNKHPGSAAIYRTLADCLTNLHQEEKARWLLEQASLLDAGSASAQKASASLHLTAGSSRTASAGTDRGFPFPLL